MVLAILRSRQG